MTKIKITCKDATLSTLKKEEGKLSFYGKMKLLLHLMSCPPCRKFITQSKLVNKKLRDYSSGLFSKPATKLSKETKDRIQNKINDVID